MLNKEASEFGSVSGGSPASMEVVVPYSSVKSGRESYDMVVHAQNARVR